jgi:hypothetical protein
VHDLRAARELVRAAGDAVVEAHAEREHDVGRVDREVRGLVAVHAEHAEEVRIARGRAAEAVDRGRVRQFEHPAELAKQMDGVGAARAAAHDRDGPLRRAQQFEGGIDRSIVGPFERRRNRPRREVVHARDLRFEDVGGNVDEHGPGARAAGHAEGGA